MKQSPYPNGEAKRQQALLDTGLLEQGREERFDRITRLAKQFFSVPITLMSLVEDNRQSFKSCQGADLCETPRSVSFCAHAIFHEAPLVVEDALDDERFYDNPLVTGSPGIRFYAGVPIKTPEGHCIGTLCLIDTRPCHFSDDSLIALYDFGAMVEEQLKADSALQSSRSEWHSALVESERRARLVIEGTQVGTWQWNIQTGETVFNERWAEIVGYTLAELEPISIETWFGLVHPDDVTESEALLTQHFRGETEAYDCKARMRHKNGGWVWVHDRGRVFEWTDTGEPLLMYGTHADITAEVDAQQALETSRDELEALVSNMPGITYQCLPDHHWTMLYISNEIDGIVGYGAQDLIHNASISYAELIHPEDADRVDTLVYAAIHAEQEWHVEYRVRHCDGHWRWVEERGRAIRGRNDYPLVLEGLLVDVTRDHQAREQLRRHHEALSLLSRIALNPDSDHAARIDYALAEAQTYLGVDNAAVSQVDGDTYTLYRIITDNPDLVPGRTVALSTTWCQLLFAHHQREVFIPRVSEVNDRRYDCFRVFPVGQYLGVLIEVEGQPFGSLAFSASAERSDDFDESERLFVQLLAQWLSEELARHLSSKRLYKLLEQVPGMIYQFRRFPDGSITFPFSSSGIQSIYGITPEMAADDGSKAFEAMHPDDIELVAESIEGSAESLESWQAKFRVRSDEGYYRWVSGQARPERLTDGSVLWHGYINDIHDQEMARQAMERNELRLRSLFEFSPIGIALNDLQTGQFIDLNEALYKPSGYSPEEFINLSYWDITPPEYHEEEQLALEHLRTEGAYGPFEKEYIRRDGSRYPVRLQGVVTYDPDDRPLIWSLTEDITNRRRMERMKDQFISTVSHELRTPLTSISGSLGLLASGTAGELPEKATKMLATAKRNAERLGTLINDLLDMEKLVAGKMPMHAERQPIKPLIQDAAESMAEYARQYNVRLQVANTDDDLVASVDASRLEQALTNLISNGIKFSPEEGTVEISMVPQGQQALIKVRDNGPGVDPSFQELLFDRFSQADGTDARRLPGTGLGLAITREIAEQMNGQVFYEDAPGGGSVFCIELPLGL
ncbi:PAS domain-containing protein [Salicola sp. Rm-C-2C1-2]|uniref:PAS domain-containing protein n=1 Tax=Salicola sp. Rm-C-2C1-2 TaxID=3141321 RepID=UPI0032E445E4